MNVVFINRLVIMCNDKKGKDSNASPDQKCSIIFWEGEKEYQEDVVASSYPEICFSVYALRQENKTEIG